MAFITSIDSVIELGPILERSEDPLLRQFHRTTRRYRMGNSLAWMLVIGGIIAAVTAGITTALWIQYFILRRWRARVRLPDPVAYTDVPSYRCDKEIILRIHSSKPIRILFNRCGAREFSAANGACC